LGYSVELTNRALKQLHGLDRRTLLLVSEFIDRLDGCDSPCTLPNAKKLQGIDNGWGGGGAGRRGRLGTYRVLGTVDSGRVVIEIFKVGHRREVYRNL